VSTDDDTPQVVAELICLLRECGRDDHAAWLEERLHVLRPVDATADARTQVMAELHGIVPGMGGLTDLLLTPGPESRYSQSAAQDKLHALADRLYQLTR